MVNPIGQEKTFFIIEDGLYYYKIMPFGLKNDEPTYQRLVNWIFNTKTRRLVKVYVDDMLVNRSTVAQHVQDLS